MIEPLIAPLRTGIGRLAPGAATLLSWVLIIEAGAESDDAHLLLSDEVVPYEELGSDMVSRPVPLTEWIEDTLIPENRERERRIEEAHLTMDLDLLDEVPDRQNLFGGNPFLASGNLDEGFESPTGAIWQPVFLLFGTARTAIQGFDDGLTESGEWVNRIDLFGNLYLTPTERILIGFRPLDREGKFTGYRFRGDDEGFFETFSARIHTLFFEGDLGELFANLDPDGSRNLDYGIALGRQPLRLQDGILLDDSIDSIGISRSSLFLFDANATRITALAGFNQIHRGDNVRDSDAFLFGLSLAMDYHRTTIEFDLLYVDGDPATGGDGVYAGIGDTRRVGYWSATHRLNGSWALEDETDAVGTGGLLTSQWSRTMPGSEDILYLDGFWGFGDFTSAARDPAVGGPLGNTGILFGSPMMGDFGSPLGNQVGDSLGFAFGYQHFFGHDQRAQIVPEIGGRIPTRGDGESSLGLGLRYQRAFGQHSVLRLDGFIAGYGDDENPDRDDFGYGWRCEWLVKY